MLLRSSAVFFGFANSVQTMAFGRGLITAPPARSTGESPSRLLEGRITSEPVTCGYRSGDPAHVWLAPSGYNCRVDTLNGLWGFCPTTVLAATDCGLGGYCFDTNTCTSGCGQPGLRNNPTITTWTWYVQCDTRGHQFDMHGELIVIQLISTPSDPQSRFCSTAFLTFGIDQTYVYLHCGPDAGTQHYMASPTASPASLSSTHSTSPSPITTPESPVSSATPSSNATSTSSMPSLASEPNKNSDGVSSGGSTNNMGAIIGGSIGGFALLCGFGVVAICLLRNNRSRGVDSLQRPRTPQGNSWSPSNVIKQGGWGPRELPAHVPSELPVHPVELPAGHDR